MIQTTLEQLLQKARQATADQQYWDAVNSYTDVLAATDPQTADPDVKDARLTSLKERGTLLSELGEQAAALAAYEQYYLEAGTSQHAVEALVLIGNRSRGLGHYERSLSAYQEALDLAVALNYAAGRAKALVGMGGTYLLQGHTEEAAGYLNKANALFEQLGDSAGQVLSINQMGIAYGATGHLHEAMLAFQQAVDLARKLRHNSSLISALNNLGECYRLLYDAETAVSYHKEGLALAEEASYRILEADLQRNLGGDLIDMGQVDEGMTYLQQALTMAQAVDAVDIELHTLNDLALAELRYGNPETGLAHARQLQTAAEQTNSRGHLAHALYALGLYHQAQEDKAAAEEQWQQALFLAHESERRLLLWQIHAALAEVSAKANLAAVHNRIAAEVIQQIAEPITDEKLCRKFLEAPPVTAVLQRLPQQ